MLKAFVPGVSRCQLLLPPGLADSCNSLPRYSSDRTFWWAERVLGSLIVMGAPDATARQLMKCRLNHQAWKRSRPGSLAYVTGSPVGGSRPAFSIVTNLAIDRKDQSRMIRLQPRSILALIGLLTLAAGLRAQPVLVSATFSGGPGDQFGRAIWISDSAILVGGATGELLRYSIPPAAPLWKTSLAGAAYLGVTVVGGTAYVVGSARPPACGASDGVGDTEGKSLISRHAISTGALIGCASTNFFPYRGGEAYFNVVAAAPYLFAAGYGETCGFGNHSIVLSKFDMDGNLVQKTAEPGVEFGGPACTGGSVSSNLTILNEDLYVVGYSTFEDGLNRPTLMRYTQGLVRVWKRRPTDNSGGRFLGIAASGGASMR